jgi:hypothetical protein
LNSIGNSFVSSQKIFLTDINLKNFKGEACPLPLTKGSREGFLKVFLNSIEVEKISGGMDG